MPGHEGWKGLGSHTQMWTLRVAGFMGRHLFFSLPTPLEECSHVRAMSFGPSGFVNSARKITDYK